MLKCWTGFKFRVSGAQGMPRVFLGFGWIRSKHFMCHVPPRRWCVRCQASHVVLGPLVEPLVLQSLSDQWESIADTFWPEDPVNTWLDSI